MQQAKTDVATSLPPRRERAIILHGNTADEQRSPYQGTRALGLFETQRALPHIRGSQASPKRMQRRGWVACWERGMQLELRLGPCGYRWSAPHYRRHCTKAPTQRADIAGTDRPALKLVENPPRDRPRKRTLRRPRLDEVDRTRHVPNRVPGVPKVPLLPLRHVHL